jgi:hypothetical protein
MPRKIRSTKPWNMRALDDLPGEVWKDVPGFEGIYEVSNLGRVFSCARTITKANGQSMRRGPVLLRPRPHPHGYKLVALFDEDHRRKDAYVHHLVWTAFKGSIPSGQEVGHSNDDCADNRLGNLFLQTRTAKGERVVFRRKRALTPEQVREVRQGGQEGMSFRSLARFYGVSATVIADVVHRKLYRAVV